MPRRKVIYSKPELLSQFLELTYPEPNTGCWLWGGYEYSHYGYGRFSQINLPFQRAHRVSYYLHYGEFDFSLCVCHKCDVKMCVNPEHLFLGTFQDNMNDREAKGRNKIMYGSNHGRSKLTEKQVLEIRGLKGLITGGEIAKQYSIGEGMVSLILNRRNWKHI